MIELPGVENMALDEIQAELDLIETESQRLARSESDFRKRFPGMAERLDQLRKKRTELFAQSLNEEALNEEALKEPAVENSGVEVLKNMRPYKTPKPEISPPEIRTGTQISKQDPGGSIARSDTRQKDKGEKWDLKGTLSSDPEVTSVDEDKEDTNVEDGEKKAEAEESSQKIGEDEIELIQEEDSKTPVSLDILLDTEAVEVETDEEASSNRDSKIVCAEVLEDAGKEHKPQSQVSDLARMDTSVIILSLKQSMERLLKKTQGIKDQESFKDLRGSYPEFSASLEKWLSEIDEAVSSISIDTRTEDIPAKVERISEAIGSLTKGALSFSGDLMRKRENIEQAEGKEYLKAEIEKVKAERCELEEANINLKEDVDLTNSLLADAVRAKESLQREKEEIEKERDELKGALEKMKTGS